MRKALVISVVMAGCAGGEADQGVIRSLETTTSGGDPSDDPFYIPWDPEQGVHVLGKTADALTETSVGVATRPYYSVSTAPPSRTAYTVSVSAAVDGAYLIAKNGTDTWSRDDSWFDNLILQAADGSQLKITGAQNISPATLGWTGVENQALAATEYFLKYRPALGGPNDWRDYCDDPEHGAIPLLGRYTKDRKHTAGASISFACNWGIAYKCTMWGFVAGTSQSSDAWKLHDACEGAGNARFCGDARSYTREKTPVWFVDNSNLPGVGLDQRAFPYPITHPDPWPGDPDRMYIESAWRDDGTPFCVSKLRWVSLPPRPCDGVLLDPRVNASTGGDGDAMFCDDMDVATLLSQPRVKLVVASKTMDMPLGRWATRRGPGAEHVSTVFGVWLDADLDGSADRGTVYPPFLDAQGNTKYKVFEGYDGMLLRNLPGTLTSLSTPLTALSMRTEASGDQHLVVGAAADPTFEGYALPSRSLVDSEYDAVTGTSFYQCSWSAIDQDTHLGNAALSGCSNGSVLGYAFPAPVVPFVP